TASPADSPGPDRQSTPRPPAGARRPRRPRGSALAVSSVRAPSPVARPSPCRSCGGSVWESNPSTVCLELSTGFEVREAHRVPRRFRRYNDASSKPHEFTIAPVRARRPGRRGEGLEPSGSEARQALLRLLADLLELLLLIGAQARPELLVRLLHD